MTIIATTNRSGPIGSRKVNAILMRLAIKFDKRKLHAHTRTAYVIERCFVLVMGGGIDWGMHFKNRKFC